MGMHDYEFAHAATKVADALASIAVEFKRYNDLRQAELQSEAARKRSQRGFG